MLRIHVFGPLEADLDGDRVTLPRGRLIRSLLAWLALHPGPHPRTRVCGLFWPDAPDAKARASLRSAVWALRIALGPTALRTDRDVVELRRDAVWVDAVEFDRLRAAGHAEQAIAICRGDLLSDHDEEWVRRLRDEYSDRLATLLAVSARAAESGGDLARARDRARSRATLRPLDEDAARELIRLSAAAGDLPAAMAAFSRLRDTLRTELDIEPTAATFALMDTVRPALPGSIELTVHHNPIPPAAPMTTAAASVGATALSTESLGTVSAAPFFGRSTELRELLSCWDRARGGAGMAVVIVGDGGMGKTRLAEEVLDVARRAGARTAIGAPGALGGAPYEMWSEMLAEVLEPDDRLPGDALWAADLARLLPTVAAYVGAADAPTATRPRGGPASSVGSATHASSPSTMVGVEHDRIRLFEAAVEFLGFLSARRPLALVLEDLQAADLSSLELLRYAGRRLSRLPVLLVLTRRPLPPRPQLDGVLAALRAKGALRLELPLKPLSPSAIRQIVRQSALLPEAVENRIVAVADGSPLLAAETARHVAHGAGDPADGLRVATGSAMARLSDAGRLFLELTAAAGRDLNRMEIASLPLLADPAAAATESLGAGLLRVREDSIGYRHESLRQAVYDDIPQLRRVRLHDALAASLQAALTDGPPDAPTDAQRNATTDGQRYASTSARENSTAASRRRQGAAGGQRRTVELARHLRLAGHRARAAAELRHAAGAARAVAAMAEAAQYLREAVELEPEDAAPMLELAEIEAWRGLLPESDAAFNRALELITPTDTDALVDAWLRRGRWLRGGLCHPREARRSYRAALDALDRRPGSHPGPHVETADHQPGSNAPARADALDREPSANSTPPAMTPDGEPGATPVLHVDAADHQPGSKATPSVEALGGVSGADPLLRAEALAGMAWAEAVAGDPEVAGELLREVDLLTHGRRLSELLTHDIGFARGHVLLRSGRFAESYGPLIAAAGAAGRAGRPDMAYSCLANAAGAAACAGDFERALDFVERCLPLVVPNGLTRLAVYVYTGQAAVLRRLGRAGEAAAALAAADTAANRLGIADLEGLVHGERAQLALDRGDFGTAAAEFRAALAADAPISRPLTRLYLAEALARNGHAAEAAAELQAVALEPMSDSDFPDTLVARMNRVEGLLAARDGDVELAAARLRAAAAGWRRRSSAAVVGRRYAANIIDLGRPPLSGLVEPDREYRLVTAELAALTERPRSSDAHLR